MDAIAQEDRRPPRWTYAVLFLPSAIVMGFVGVTLGFTLKHEGISVSAVAALVSLALLPFTWKFLLGPLLDLTLTPKIWHAGCSAVTGLGILALGAVPHAAASLPLLDGLALVTGAAGIMAGAAAATAIGRMEPETGRESIGGWIQVGTLGGTGLGGGAGLWLAQHAGGTGVAGAVLGAVCLASTLPLLSAAVPAHTGTGGFRGETVQLLRGLWAFVRSRDGALALLLNVLPMGLGASNQLWAAVAGDWKASADLVALVTGALGGLASIPGCLLAVGLCRMLSPRVAYCLAAAGGAAILMGMAAAPHTPLFFVLFTLSSAMVLGLTWGALSSVTYDCIGRDGVATKVTLISSASNLPLIVAVAFIGGVQTRQGSNAMLLAEAGIAVAALVAYAMIARFTERRIVNPGVSPAAASAG